VLSAGQHYSLLRNTAELFATAYAAHRADVENDAAFSHLMRMSTALSVRSQEYLSPQFFAELPAPPSS
jgi:hypothetical protein